MSTEAGDRDLTAVVARAATDPAGALAAFPWLGAAIDADADAGRFARWGRSTVVDENVGAPVVSPGVFAALHARAGLSATWPVGNAGLLHVYGYLLSTVATPYGLKRERWLDGALARAYGLPSDAFVPWARDRTLLARVDAAASAVARDHPVRTASTPAGEATLALARMPATGPWALVSTVAGRLVTTFPVSSREAVLQEWDADPTRLRWNAVG